MVMSGKNKHYAVLGLGRFGMSIVQTLSEETEANVLACDKNEVKVQRAAEFATHAVQVDLTDENSLKKLGLGNFHVVILAIGEDFETSLINAMIAKEQGARYIIVKARKERQKVILKSIGVDEVILPEHEMGERLARRLSGSNIMDILGESDAYTIYEMRPLEEWVGRTVQQADIRRQHHFTILAIRRGDELQIPITPNTQIAKDDVLIVLNEKE